jgi:hypothetical protein
MTGVASIGLMLLVSLLLGAIAYRRTLGRGPYSGSMRGALGVASILGVFLGLSIGFGTLLLVLVIRAAR